MNIFLRVLKASRAFLINIKNDLISLFFVSRVTLIKTYLFTKILLRIDDKNL